MSFSFGSAAPASTAPKPAFSFGTPAASTSTPAANPFAQAASGSLFGGQGQQQQQTNSNPFGQATTGGATGSLFGGAGASTSQPAASTSLFGQASQPAAAPSLFGQAPQQAGTTGGGLFGSAQPAAGTSSLFGGGAGASTSQQQPSLFGTSSLFGQPQRQQQQQQQVQQPAVTAAPLFGQSQSAASASLFGSKPPSSSLFGTSTTTTTSQPQPQPLPKLGDPYPPPNPNEPSIESRLEAIKNAWDPNTASCKFQTYFYNVPAPPNTVQQYQSPPPGADAKEWRKAIRENPDPEHLVPAIAVGFAAIQKRIESQQRQSQAHQGRLAEIQAHLSTLSSTHSLTTSLRTLRASQTATALTARLLSLIAKSSALSPNRNQSTRKEEELLRITLEGMRGEVEETKGRGNDLWAGVGALKARKMETEGTEWAVADEEGLRKIMEILTAQQAGLDHLTKTLDAAAADVEVMNEAFGLKQSQDGGR